MCRFEPCPVYTLPPRRRGQRSGLLVQEVEHLVLSQEAAGSRPAGITALISVGHGGREPGRRSLGKFAPIVYGLGSGVFTSGNGVRISVGVLQVACCVACCEPDPVVLEFDHVPGEKRMNVKRMLAGT